MGWEGHDGEGDVKGVERPMGLEIPLARGTYAERLAAVGCNADHALWALSHGANWTTAWGSCPRPDWLAEAFVLSCCREGGGPDHRRLVGWLGAETERAWTAVALRADPGARARVLRCTMAVRAAAAFAQDWGKKRPGGPPDFAAFPVSSLFDREEASWTPSVAAELSWNVDGEALAIAHAALRAACSALSGDAPGGAMRALAWAYAGKAEAPELAARFAKAFPCPLPLRCELPA